MTKLFDPDRPLFSQREGIKPLPEPFRLNNIPDLVRAELVDLIIEDFRARKRLSDISGQLDENYSRVFAELNHVSYHRSYDRSAVHKDQILRIIETGQYNEVLDLLEVYQRFLPDQSVQINRIFNKHKAAYTLITSDSWHRFVPRTCIEDSVALQQNIDDLSGDKFKPVRDHLHKAITTMNMLDEDAKNFGSAINHCIGAVETACKVATGNPKADVKTTIEQMPVTSMTEHTAFRKAVVKLYGFTSDAGGLRHGGEGEYDLADTLFMLSICAAICSYIIQKFPAEES